MTISGHIGLIPFAGAANGNNRISVQDNILGGIIDDYRVTVDVDLTSEILYFSLHLSDVTGMAFSDDSLLLSPPDIGLFNLANIRFVRGAEDIDLSGQLTSLIPEPGTLLLLSLGVFAVMSPRKRNRTRVLIGFGVVVLLSLTVTTEVRAQWAGGPVLIGGDDTDHHFPDLGDSYIREGFNFLGAHRWDLSLGLGSVARPCAR
jgi:hypothetical protein